MLTFRREVLDTQRKIIADDVFVTKKSKSDVYSHDTFMHNPVIFFLSTIMMAIRKMDFVMKYVCDKTKNVPKLSPPV